MNGGRLPGAEIQRLVLHDAPGPCVSHLLIQLPEHGGARHFLRELLARWPLTSAWARAADCPRHFALGLTYRGLERLMPRRMPSAVMAQFLLRAPAFAAGAPQRAAEHLGDTGPSASMAWDPGFGLDEAHAVFTAHAGDDATLDRLESEAVALATKSGAALHTVRGAHIGAPPGREGNWVHFGFRDGLSRVAVDGWHGAGRTRGVSRHAAGEFLLGHRNDDGFNRWLLANEHEQVRRFFLNGSFGALRRVEQDVADFEDWVAARAQWLGDRFGPIEDSAVAAGRPADASWSDYVRAKVCGRWPDGRPVMPPGATAHAGGPEDDFDHEKDPDGTGCPFGAHIRRMNPRLRHTDSSLARPDSRAFRRHRPLVRRGRPYGPMWQPGQERDGEPRGLVGVFFCASLEDQFEHLIGHWAERPPLGVADGGTAKDPLTGHHEDPNTTFELPMPDGRPIQLLGLRSFVRTRGTVYAFYPSLPALKLLLDNARFFDLPVAPLEP